MSSTFAPSQVWTTLSVRELLAMPPSALALRLRNTLQAHTPQTVGARAQWLLGVQRSGCSTRQVFDARALTFIVSSWGFDWEAAHFGASPVCYDHGALTPVVAVLVPRPKGDGLNVYSSGSQAAVEHFAPLMLGP